MLNHDGFSEKQAVATDSIASPSPSKPFSLEGWEDRVKENANAKWIKEQKRKQQRFLKTRKAKEQEDRNREAAQSAQEMAQREAASARALAQATAEAAIASRQAAKKARARRNALTAKGRRWNERNHAGPVPSRRGV